SSTTCPRIQVPRSGRPKTLQVLRKSMHPPSVGQGSSYRQHPPQMPSPPNICRLCTEREILISWKVPSYPCKERRHKPIETQRRSPLNSSQRISPYGSTTPEQIRRFMS